MPKNGAIQEARAQIYKELAASASGEVFRLLQTIPGIGPYIASSIIGEIQDIHRFQSAKELTAFAGLDPKIRQSGKSLNSTGRLTKRGSSYLRRSIFIGANIARQHDVQFKALYDKKKSEGKTHKVATCAVARKATVLNCKCLTKYRRNSRMSYSSNPLLPKARADAVRLLVEQKLPVAVAARKSGIHRTTLWRWHKQWLELNQNVQLTNDNRPGRVSRNTFRLAAVIWRIPTKSSRPHSCRHAVSQAVVDRITYYRSKYGRCAVVVHGYCEREGTSVSLSTVRRLLDRLGLLAKRKWKRGYRPPITRPAADKPGDLVQTDIVHLYDHATKQRTYLYTLIDVYSRWSYSEHHTVLSQKLAGEAYAGFHFNMVQADNGPEFGRHFEELLRLRNTTVRHSRVRRPNDNAYVERFNRTIQEECTGSCSSITNNLNSKVLTYLAYYNDERLHLGLQCKTPLEMLQRS